MLLYASGSGTQKLNTGTVFYGGNVPSGDNRITAGLNIQSALPHYNYISTGAGSGLYLGSGIVGGTLAADDRDDAIIYLSQKRDLAGVASNKLAQSVFGPTRLPDYVVSGSVTIQSGWNYLTGAAASTVVTGETYATTADTAVSGAGRYTIGFGAKNPISSGNPAR